MKQIKRMHEIEGIPLVPLSDVAKKMFKVPCCVGWEVGRGGGGGYLEGEVPCWGELGRDWAEAEERKQVLEARN